MLKELWNEVQGIYVTTKIRLWCAELRFLCKATMKNEEEFKILYKKACQYYWMTQLHIENNLKNDPTLVVPVKVSKTRRIAMVTMENIIELAKERGINVWPTDKKIYLQTKQDMKEQWA